MEKTWISKTMEKIWKNPGEKYNGKKYELMKFIRKKPSLDKKKQEKERAEWFLTKCS